MGQIHLGDIGTRFVVTILKDGVVVDISGATKKDIIFKRPNNTTITKSGNFVTDGTDGKIDYFSVADDLDKIGTWEIQSKITISSGTWSSNIESFEVFKNLT